MALKLVIKSKPAAAPTVDVAEYAEEIDNVGRLKDAAEKVQAKIDKLREDPDYVAYAKALAALQLKVDADPDHEPDEENYVVYGNTYTVELGKKASNREITDMEKVKKYLGQKTFMEIATVKLGDIDKYLTLPQRKEVTTTNRGKRTIKAVRERKE